MAHFHLEKESCRQDSPCFADSLWFPLKWLAHFGWFPIMANLVSFQTRHLPSMPFPQACHPPSIPSPITPPPKAHPRVETNPGQSWERVGEGNRASRIEEAEQDCDRRGREVEGRVARQAAAPPRNRRRAPAGATNRSPRFRRIRRVRGQENSQK